LQFKDIIGHTKLKEQFIHAISINKFSHANLFYGPVGNQALALALALAQYLNCENKTEKDSCGVCSSCNKISKIIHPDLHFSFPAVRKKSDKPSLSSDFIDKWRTALLDNVHLSEMQWMDNIGDGKQGNISAEECSEIIRKLSLKAYEAKYKVMIIWMADKLGKESNKLLKVIEEPPSNTIFILIAIDIDNILGTIKSRCQLRQVNRLMDEEIIEYLNENTELEEIEIQQIVSVAEGNINKALLLSESFENNFSELTVNWFRACFKKDPASANQLIEEIKSLGKEEQKDFLKYNLELLRSVIYYKGKADTFDRINSNEQELLKYLAQKLNFEQISAFIKQYENLLYYIERNANMKIQYFYSFIAMSVIIKNNSLSSVS